MARGVELATAYVTLTAETSQVSRSIGKMFASADKSASTAGASMGKAMKSAFERQKPVDMERLSKDVENAERRLASAVERASREQEAARRKVEIAEAKVAETRERTVSSAKAVKDAEKQLASVRDAGDAEAIAQAEQDLSAARERVARSSADMSAEDRLVRARQEQERATLEAASAQERLERELNDAKSALEGAASSTDSTAGRFESMGDRIKAVFRGDFKEAFQRVERDGLNAAREVEGDFTRAGKDASEGFGGNFRRGLSGALGGLGLYFGASEIVDFGKSAVSGAADLEQSIGAVESVFGSSASSMLAWSEAADRALGLTATEYNEFASVLGASLKNAGTPMDQLAGRTDWLITLGADLASLYGGTTADAVSALGSALRGEMDPIERYGISLNDAALTAEGLRMGIEKTGGAFSTQEKQLIAMSLLQEQSADATGNFAREQDTAANVGQRLTARLKEVAAEFGAKLLPTLVNVGNWLLESGLPAFESFTETLGSIAEWIKQNQAWLTVLAVGLGVAGAAAWVASGGLTAVGLSIAGAFTALSMGIKSIPVIGWVIAAITLLVGALTWFFTQTEIGRGIWEASWGAIKAAAAGVVSWFQGSLVPIMAAAWNGIKVAIGVAVAMIMTYIDAWVWVLKNTLAPILQWLWKSVVSPVWNGIKAAVGAVVAWFKGSAWPMISAVIGWVASGFQGLYTKLSDIWTGIRVRVIAPVTSWLINTFKPQIDMVTRGVKAAFEVMRDGIRAAWNAVRDAARAPVRFVVDTVLNGGLIKNFNTVAGALGVKKLPAVKIAGFARGGILPGWSRMSDGDDQLVPMRRGEGVLVSEGLRTARDKEAFLAANAAGRRGVGFADFLGGGFARGGIFDGVKNLAGDAWDAVKGIGGLVAEVLSDPKGALNRVISSAMSRMPGAGLMLDVAKAVPGRVVDGLASMIGAGASAAGGVPSVGRATRGGGSLALAQRLARGFGLTMTSHRRGGSRTAGSGSVSLHASGRAMDFSNGSGPTPQMMAFFNAMHPYKPTELLYSPAGARQWRRSGRMGDTSGVTKRMHYNHVHVGFRNGGIYKPFLHDQGGWHNPGELSLNMTRRPEPVLTAGQWDTMMRIADHSVDPGPMELSAEDRALLASIRDAVDIKIDGRSMTAAVRGAQRRMAH